MKSDCILFCSECMDLLRELNAPVKYIVLPSHAYEHKVSEGSMAE